MEVGVVSLQSAKGPLFLLFLVLASFTVVMFKFFFPGELLFADLLSGLFYPLLKLEVLLGEPYLLGLKVLLLGELASIKYSFGPPFFGEYVSSNSVIHLFLLKSYR